MKEGYYVVLNSPRDGLENSRVGPLPLDEAVKVRNLDPFNRRLLWTPSSSSSQG